MRTRDIKINRHVQFNISYKKLNTINPVFVNEVFKIVETVNLPTGILVHVRALNFPKVALWVSSAHIEPMTQSATKSKTPESDPVPTAPLTTIQPGCIVQFNSKFNRELNYRFKVFENYEHIKKNNHVVLNTADRHPSSWIDRDEPAIKINCWWLPASWFEVVAKGDHK